MIVTPILASCCYLFKKTFIKLKAINKPILTPLIELYGVLMFNSTTSQRIHLLTYTKKEAPLHASFFCFVFLFNYNKLFFFSFDKLLKPFYRLLSFLLKPHLFHVLQHKKKEAPLGTSFFCMCGTKSRF